MEKTKTVKDSSIELVQQMTQLDANLAGFVHGGSVMKIIDNTAGIVASRHTNAANVVTASIDRLDFHSPVMVGDLLRVKAGINYIGRTSIEIGVRVEAENFITGEIRHTASAYLIFVSLDENRQIIEVPPIIFETDEEKRRNREAGERRKYRMAKLGKTQKV